MADFAWVEELKIHVTSYQIETIDRHSLQGLVAESLIDNSENLFSYS